MTPIEALRKIVEDYRLIAERLAKQAWNLGGDDIEDDAARIDILTTELQAEIERMENEQRELADAAKALAEKRWPVSSKPPKDEFIGSADTHPPADAGMVMVPEVLMRQISKWIAESAEPYDKAAYAINGLIAAAEGKE